MAPWCYAIDMRVHFSEALGDGRGLCAGRERSEQGIAVRDTARWLLARSRARARRTLRGIALWVSEIVSTAGYRVPRRGERSERLPRETDGGWVGYGELGTARCIGFPDVMGLGVARWSQSCAYPVAYARKALILLGYAMQCNAMQCNGSSPVCNESHCIYVMGM